MLGPVCRTPRKLFFGSAKPFLVNFYLNTERCIRLKLLVRGELIQVMLRICKWHSSVMLRLRLRFCYGFLGDKTFRNLRETASWTLDITVWTRVLPGFTVLRFWTRHLYLNTSLHPCKPTNGYMYRELNRQTDSQGEVE